ncbi:MAG: release factor glutamine methyltransferase [Mucilaginibacter sp.]|nr:release factor glutamine methyltransferase [Mucilaginibacter sp.]
MNTLKDVFADFKKGLEKVYEPNEIEALTLLVISEILNLSKAQVKAFPEKEVSSSQVEKLVNILSELKSGKPLQYIAGKTEFYGLPFNVNPSVLIPRPETEELVEWVISSVRKENRATGAILDIGTGSGCIAISLKEHLPGFEISAIDISIKALQTAKENAELNQVDIDFIEADILNFKSEIEHSKFEIIVSNPPYVTLADKTQMHINVTDFEPHSALFVPENDPLIFYKAITEYAVDHITDNGMLFFEINENYSEQTIELLSNKGFINIELRQDMSGRDRMIKALLNSFV